MRALITGAEGFLGANLCRALIAAGHEVVGTSLNRKGQTSLDALGISCRVEYGDVTDSAFLERVLASSEAEWVFHLAAVSIVRVAQANPATALRTNILGTVNVLEACRRLGKRIAAVVVASSDKAYGDYSGLAYHEGLSLRPVAPYEVSKATADLIAQSYACTYDMPVKVARCANLYGPGDLNWSRLVPNSCRQVIEGKAPIVHAGAETMRREYLYVADACTAYIRLAECGAPGPYNVGSGDRVSTMEVAILLADMLGGQAPVVEHKAAAFAEIPAQTLCTEKIRHLGWRPRAGLTAGLAATAAWYRAYLGAWEPVKA